MKQFEMYLANEYCEEILDDLSKKMSITYEILGLCLNSNVVS